ncbi:DUF5359 family protein [Niallia sp. NCCP-28]|uniref:DUF5359 family protein n=1 Tax=Niallia sp. NCCP-28 TaxID=2934712 RepID=UPI002086FD07|nr:DUF5359 family protein [Niallia sp. NCCP-28]GKU81021.1 hypothetical protein NCCP28_04170 [Niallia sp. NCCP-28]
MKKFERIIIKIIIIQFAFLAASQMIHHWDLFPKLYELAEYEGVSKSNFTKILETFEQNN